MTSSPSRKAAVEDAVVIVGLIMVQLIGAASIVFLSPFLSLGIKPLFLVTFGSLSTFALVCPFAIALEKTRWPARLSPTLMVQFVLLALGGVTTFQALLLLGVKKTSPAIASAMPNLAPGVIFVVAACLRFEKFEIKCFYSRAKVIGTLVCLGGAVVLSFLQSPSPSPVKSSSRPAFPSFGDQHLAQAINEDWLIGCLCLLGAVLVVSFTTVLQAVTMVHFEAPLTLCAITSLLGAILTAAVQIVTEGRIDIGSPGALSIASIVAIAITGGTTSSACVAFQMWAVKRKGPVLVSMFSPVQTVCSGILSAIVLGQVIKVGSLVAMMFMFSGLYIVLWAKSKEGEDEGSKIADFDEDLEKPLIS
ncbi:WAT1-related protein [Canna indica]|uniref:WAT1-related protein n=1 Tax=Canna indica TaxID=4628 RepID=A0AAQ3KJR9_9LILI|nr:WAT1-related protein [Canna indica]